VSAVRTVAAGEATLDAQITRRLIHKALAGSAPGRGRDELSMLTEREIEVLQQVARGSSNADIAATVFLSEATVKTYLSRIMAKTQTRSRAQLVVLAYETGLIRPGDQRVSDNHL